MAYTSYWENNVYGSGIGDPIREWTLRFRIKKACVNSLTEKLKYLDAIMYWM